MNRDDTSKTWLFNAYSRLTDLLLAACLEFYPGDEWLDPEYALTRLIADLKRLRRPQTDAEAVAPTSLSRSNGVLRPFGPVRTPGAATEGQKAPSVRRNSPET